MHNHQRHRRGVDIVHVRRLYHARMRTHNRVLAQMEHLPSPVGPPTMYIPVGGSLTCVGIHRKSADIDGLFERLTDSDSEYNDDDEDDYVCRVWVLAYLPEGDRVRCVS